MKLKSARLFSMAIALPVFATAMPARAADDVLPADQSLVDQLKNDGDASRRVSAAAALATDDDPGILDALAGALHDSDTEVRVRAVKSVAMHNTDRAAEILGAAANDPAQPAEVRSEACTRLGQLAVRLKSETPVAALVTLTRSDSGPVRQSASAVLGKAVGGFDAATLATLSRSSNAGVSGLAQTQAAQAGGDPGPAPAVAQAAAAASPSAFSEDDRQKLATWLQPQEDRLKTAIIACGKQKTAVINQFARNKKPTEVQYRREQNQLAQIGKQMGSLQLAKRQLTEMKPADEGAAIYRKAEQLLGQSFSADLSSRFIGDAARQMAAEPAEHHTLVNGFGQVVGEYDSDNTGPALLGALISLAGQAQAQSMKAEGTRLKAILQSLSPSARKAIADRLTAADSPAGVRGR